MHNIVGGVLKRAGGARRKVTWQPLITPLVASTT
jgi:hypothetical protein